MGVRVWKDFMVTWIAGGEKWEESAKRQVRPVT